MIYWYTLNPIDILMLRDAKPFSPQERAWASSSFPPSGHTIAGALSVLTNREKGTYFSLIGPFLCYDQKELYFSRPLGYVQDSPLIPVDWNDKSPLSHVISDPARPKPLVKLNDHVNHTDLENTQQSFDHKFRQYLPYSVILKYLKEGIISKEDWYVKIDGEDKPYQEETRPHNTIQEGTRQVKEADGYFIEKAIRFKNHWSLAIGLDRELPSPVALRLGGEGHRVILQRCTTLDQQWVKLQTQSNQNFTKGGKAIAYLITPGVFERIHQGKAMCRAWPWEWKVSEGNLAGVATDKAIPINSRIQSKQNTSIPAPQVFAAPQGSQYYLNKPDYLFADSDNPNTKDIQSSQAYQRAKRYLDLGYSKLFWLNYRGE